MVNIRNHSHHKLHGCNRRLSSGTSGLSSNAPSSLAFNIVDECVHFGIGGGVDQARATPPSGRGRPGARPAGRARARAAPATAAEVSAFRREESTIDLRVAGGAKVQSKSLHERRHLSFSTVERYLYIIFGHCQKVSGKNYTIMGPFGK